MGLKDKLANAKSTDWLTKDVSDLELVYNGSNQSPTVSIPEKQKADRAFLRQ